MPRILFFTPVTLAVFALFTSAAAAAWSYLWPPFPLFPWHAAMMLEGGRKLLGDTYLTEDAATTIYGALYPWYLATLYKLFGFSNVVGRVASLICSLLAVVSVCLISCKRHSLTTYLFAAGLFSAAYFACFETYIAPSPDMLPLLLSIFSLIALYTAFERNNRWAFSIGAALGVLAFFCKQTYLAVFAIPPLASLLSGKLSERHRTEFSLVLALTVVVVLGCLKWLMPKYWHFMIETVAQYPISLSVFLVRIADLLAYAPLFFWIAFTRLVSDSGYPETNRDCWFDASVLVAIPTSALAYAKLGGGANSLLHALFAMAGFCLYHLDSLQNAVTRVRRSATALLTGGLVGLAICLPTREYLHGFTSSLPWSLVARLQNDPRWQDYPEILRAVATLPSSSVISPSDPSITIMARRVLSPSLYEELDHTGWGLDDESARTFQRSSPSDREAHLKRALVKTMISMIQHSAAEYVVLEIHPHYFFVDSTALESIEKLGYSKVFQNSSYLLLRKI